MNFVRVLRVLWLEIYTELFMDEMMSGFAFKIPQRGKRQTQIT